MYLRWNKHKHNNAFCVRGFLWFRGGRFFGLLKQVVRTTLLFIIITTTTHYYTFLLCSMYKGIGDFSWCSTKHYILYLLQYCHSKQRSYGFVSSSSSLLFNVFFFLFILSFFLPSSLWHLEKVIDVRTCSVLFVHNLRCYTTTII